MSLKTNTSNLERILNTAAPSQGENVEITITWEATSSYYQPTIFYTYYYNGELYNDIEFASTLMGQVTLNVAKSQIILIQLLDSLVNPNINGSVTGDIVKLKHHLLYHSPSLEDSIYLINGSGTITLVCAGTASGGSN